MPIVLPSWPRRKRGSRPPHSELGRANFEHGVRDDADVPDSEGSRELADLGIDTTLASGTAVAEFFHPGSSIVLGALGPALSVGLKHVLRRLARLRAHIEEAGANFDDLVGRCDGDEQKAQLLIATLGTAREAGTEEQLLAIAEAFVTAATSKNEFIIGFETTMVRTVAGLGPAHMKVLRAFVNRERSQWATQRADGKPPLNWSPPPTRRTLARRLGSDSEQVIDGLVGELIARGLVVEIPPTGVGNALLPQTDAGLLLTEFAGAVMERLKLLSEMVAEDPPAT